MFNTFAQTEDTEDVQKTDLPLRILAIGNSHAKDAAEYMYKIPTAAGYKEVISGTLWSSSFSLDDHLAGALDGKSSYSYREKSSQGTRNYAGFSFLEALQWEDWDYIILQQQSLNAGKPETFGSLAQLVPFIRRSMTNPDAEIGWHMTWAYSVYRDSKEFEEYNYNQELMYKAITETTKNVVEKINGIDFVIPVGTAIQNCRTSYIGETLTRDGSHLVSPHGRYLAGLCWFSKITGRSVYEFDKLLGKNINMPATYWPMLQEVVENAIADPYRVTTSAHQTLDDRIPIKNAEITVPNDNPVYDNSVFIPEVNVEYQGMMLKNNWDYYVLDSNQSDAGKRQIAIVGIGDFIGTAIIDVRVAPKPLRQTEIRSIPSKAYTGKAFSPPVTVYDKNKKLRKDRDYSVSYVNNTRAGKARAVVKGRGNYKGTRAKSFTINKKKIKSIKISKIKTRTYNGKKHKPAIVVKDGKKKLKRNRDYTVTYKRNRNPGIAQAYIRGKGGYKGNILTSFTIRPDVVSNVRVNKRESGKERIRWKRDRTAHGIQMQYSKNRQFRGRTTQTVMLKGTSAAKNIENPDEEKIYYKRLRKYVMVNNRKIYSRWTNV
ncbi:MAG: DUF4886 domain-containing protein [Oscillospiraceae bacterium]|nr:DUF4886 domain-containing protein [Oscillospiraceae bacterium]